MKFFVKFLFCVVIFSQIPFSIIAKAENSEEKDTSVVEQLGTPDSAVIVQVSSDDDSKKNKFDKFIDEESIKEVSKEEQTTIDTLVPILDSLTYNQVLEVIGGPQMGIIPENDANGGKEFDKIQIEDSFNVIKENKELFITRLVQAYPETTKEEFQEKLKEILFVGAYFYNWFNVQIGEKNLWNVLMFQHQELTKDHTNSIDHLVNWLANQKKENLLLSKDIQKYFEKNQIFTELKVKSYKGLIEWYVEKEAHTTDYTQWFREYFNGTIYKDTMMDPSYDVGSWQKNITKDLPYLLSLKPNSDFIIGELRNETFYTTQSNYKQDVTEVVTNVAALMNNYTELLERTMVEGKEFTKKIGERFIKDRVGATNDILGSSSDLAKYYLAIQDFGFFRGVAAYGGAGTIQMCSYLASNTMTIAHEFAHELDGLIKANGEFFSTYQNRRGNGAFADFFTEVTGESNSETLYTNKSSDRFQVKQDLMNYASRYESLIYVFDGAVAEVVLDLPLEEQINYLKKTNIEVDKGYFIKDGKPDSAQKPTSRFLTMEELESYQLKTIDDLIDQGIKIIEPTDETDNNNTGTSLTYASFFMHQGKNISEYNQFHRIINTLFAHDGWEGFIGYNKAVNESGGIENAVEGLQKIYNNPSLTYRSLLKENYKKYLDRAKNEGIKTESFEELKQNISRNLDKFYSIKKLMAIKYLNISDEFKTDIFGEDKKLVHEVNSYDELIEALNNFPNDKIILMNNIIAEDKDSLVPVFRGKLIGNGHTIKGLTHPLLERSEGAIIESLILNEVDINQSGEDELGLGSVTKEAKNTFFSDIHVQGNLKGEGGALVGGIVGKMTSSSVTNSSADVRLFGKDIGGIVGQTNGESSLINVYTMGEILNGRRVGGIIGNGRNNSSLKNSYSTMTIHPEANQDSGGIIGSSYDNNENIFNLSNSLSLGDNLSDTGYKVQKNYIGGKYENNYELDSSKGNSSVGIKGLDVKEVKAESVKDTDFYKNSLKWDTEQIWNTEDLNEGYPTLRNSDPRENNTLKAPDVDPLNTEDKQITGKAEAKALLTVVANQKVIGKGVADEKGNYKIEIAPQSLGTEIRVKQETDKGSSNFTKVIVKNYIVYVKTYDELIQGLLDYPSGIIELKQDIVVEGSQIDTKVPIFTGQLIGNGYAIKELRHPLIEKIEGATIESIVFKEVFIDQEGSADSGLGALGKDSKKSTIRDVHVQGSIKGTGGVQVGGVVGEIEDSIVEESSTNVWLSGQDTGGLVGVANNSTFKNSYSLGEIATGRRAGGLIGNGRNNSSLNSGYSEMTIQSNIINEGNGIIGSVYDGLENKFHLSNVLSLGDTLFSEGYKVQNSYSVGENKNNYELSSTKGKSSTGIKGLDVKEVTESDVNQANFYKESLKWDTENIWLIKSEKEGYPSLRNSDPRSHFKLKSPEVNPVDTKDKKLTGTADPHANIQVFVNQKIIGKGKADKEGMYEISIPLQNLETNIQVKQETAEGSSDFTKITVQGFRFSPETYDELVQGLLDYPSEIIELKKNLVVEGEHKDTLISNFKGRLIGNGYTIKGLTHPLFEKLEKATIESLVLSKIKIEQSGSDDSGLGGLAKQATNSSITDTHVQGSIKGEGGLLVGGLIGQMVSSSITNSSADVSLTGKDIGGIVGQSKDKSSVKNVYTIGEITTGRRVGGIIGNGKKDTSVENSYSAMTIQSNAKPDVGGIIGSAYDSSGSIVNVSNSLSLGNILSSVGYKVQNNYLGGKYHNNYELDSSKGNSSVGIKELNVKEITESELQKETFYSETLKWDTSTVWNTDFVKEDYPSLRNSDPRNKEIEKLKAPEVNPLTDQDQVITGKGVPKAIIHVKVLGKEIGSGVSDGKGEFHISIHKQKEATEVEVTQTVDDKESSPAKIIVTHKEYKKSHIFHEGYWTNYGLVLNGQVQVEGLNMPTLTSNVKKLEMIDEKGIVIKTIPTVNTNWYSSASYDGYQAIISEEILGDLKNGEYELQVSIMVSGKDVEIVPFTFEKLFSYSLFDYQKEFLFISPNNIGHKIVNTAEKNKHGSLQIHSTDQPFMGLISEGNEGENRFINGYILNTDFDFYKTHQKNLIITNNDGEEVKRISDVHTWDLTNWGLSIKDLNMKSGFQIIIPEKYRDSTKYKYKMEVEADKELQLEINLDKIK